MTDGYGSRAIWRIALPMIISNLSVPLLGAVDTAVVGHLDSPNPLAGVAIGAAIFSLAFMSMNFLRMGTTGVAAQEFGRDDPVGMARILRQGLWLAAAISGLLLLLQVPLIAVGIRVMDPDPAVAELAAAYSEMRIWGAPATLGNFVLIGWYLGRQDARTPLMITLAINVTNIVLDLLFVVAFGWGVVGVAAASVIGELTGLTVGLYLARRYLGGGARIWWGSLSESGFADLLKVNGDIFIRTLTLMFSFAYFTALGSRLGSAFLAANAVLMNFQYIMSYGLDGLAHAAEALVGKAVGRADKPGMSKAVTAVLIWSGSFALGFAGLFLVAGPLLIDALTGIDEIRTVAREYLPWLVLSPLISFWSFAYDGIFIGATRSREMRNTMLLSCFLVFVPSSFVLAGWENHGLWAAFLLFMAARGASMAVSWHGKAARLAIEGRGG